MAEQLGDKPLKGRIGDMIYYTWKGKPCARRAPKKVNQTQGTRRSKAEFGVASAAGAILRTGFHDIIMLLSRYKVVTNRLNVLLAVIVRSGRQPRKRVKQVLDGNVSLLRNFEFNPYTKPSSLIRVTPHFKIVPNKQLTLTLPPFDITKCISANPKASYVRIVTTCCITGLNGKDDYSTHTENLWLNLKKQKQFAGGHVDFSLVGADNCLITLAAGIAYYTTAGTEDDTILEDRLWIAGRIIYAVVVKKGKIVRFNNFRHEGPDDKPRIQKTSGWKINT